MSEPAKRRVLVIDDDEMSREVLALLLDEEGYSVETAGSGDEALMVLAASGGAGGRAPEVVLTDLQMPGVAGEDLARRLRAACGKGTRLLAMSGSRPLPDLTEAFDGFLLKPFSMGDFDAAARSAKRKDASPRATHVAASASPGEVLNATIFEGFAGMMGSGALVQFYGTCLRDAGEQLEEMRSKAAAADDLGFRMSAHTMKGSLGMVGARELQGMCARLEESGMGDDYVTTLDEFGAALGRLRRMLMARGVHLPAEDQGQAEEYVR